MRPTRKPAKKNPPKDRHDVAVKVYLRSAEEKTLLEAEASRIGLKLSSYLRNLAMEAVNMEERKKLAAERQLGERALQGDCRP